METFKSFLRLSFSILLIRYSFASQKPHCNAAEQSSLLQFKHSFLSFGCHPPTSYNKLSSWKPEKDCCSWDGVRCDNQTGHVIMLDLWNSCLFGSINSSSPLFRLVHLKSLNLSSNNFNLSKIPEGIRNMSRLTHLDLSSSNFAGQIPAGILQLLDLVYLDLSRNSLILRKPSLEDVVESITHLNELRLIDVDISFPVPHSMSNLTSLSSLVLENCTLLGVFPRNVLHLPNLHVLSLWHNPNLSVYLPEFHAGSPLEELRLDGTDLSGHIPDSIGNLESLQIFSARGSRLEGALPASIGNLTKLNVLDLSENFFSGDIPSSIGNLFQLNYLALSGNGFSSSTLHLVSKLSNLRTLDLSNINLYGSISPLQNLTKLSGLWLDSNLLIGKIPSWFGNFTNLTFLHITDNQLQGSIPNSIFELPSIQSVGLHHNNLGGPLSFDSFLQAKRLSVLQLSGNHLSIIRTSYANVTLPKFELLGLGGCNLSEFPSFLRVQHELRALILYRNNIKGIIPDWILNLKRLSVLHLRNNFLTSFDRSPRVGNTTSLCGLPPSLLVLDLSSNNLRGNLPPCFGSYALFLTLRNNSLSGKIPDNFSSGCKLKGLDLSRNRLEGEVPRSLSNCSMLEVLNLEDNRIIDVFPSWLGVLPHLKVLSLRSNKFCGAIGQPLSKLEFNRLQIIDLSNNSFTGKLPMEYFRNWVGMETADSSNLARIQLDIFRLPYDFLNSSYTRVEDEGTPGSYEWNPGSLTAIDMSSNMFEGEIPELIGSLRALQLLNLSNNILTGRIPPFLGNLWNLEVLDLSVNELSGDIPEQLTRMTSLAFFDVSHNNLTGPVPLDSQFGKFPSDSFSANPGLCGPQLSKTCEEKAETFPLPPSMDGVEVEHSFFEFGWEVLLLGFGCGFVVGAAFGCTMDTSKYESRNKRYARRRLYVHF